MTSDRARVARALSLVVALTLTEGAGLLLLFPLLSIAGVQAGVGAPQGVVDAVAKALNFLGLPPTLPAVLVVFVVLVAFRALLQRHETVLMAELEQDFIQRQRARLYDAIAGSNWTHFTRMRSADFAHALTADSERAGMALSQALQLAQHVALSVAYVLLAGQLSPALTAVALGIGASLLLVLSKTNLWVHRYGESVSKAVAELHGAVMEHLLGMKTARSYGAEKRNAQAFAALARTVGSAELTMVRSQTASILVHSIGGAVLLGIAVYSSLTWFQLSAPSLLLFLLLFSRLIPRTSAGMSALHHIVAALPSYENVRQLTEACEASSGETTGTPTQNAPRLKAAIQLRHVTFRYDSRVATPTLDDVSVDIPAGRTTAIVGVSGAGKSTVADLVLGLLRADQGTVTIDDQPLNAGNVQDWRDQIGFVPQEMFLLHDTVRANLLWASPTASTDDLWIALRAAAADEFVLRLPKGLDSVVGDRGSLISGGERQRLALARALLRRPQLLVMDEATNSLDVVNEQRILDSLRVLHGRTTVLIVTHRLATVRHADLIHVMCGGRIEQSGTWSELLSNSSGAFFALGASQGLMVRAVDPSSTGAGLQKRDSL